jgi:hypothetical protein
MENGLNIFEEEFLSIAKEKKEINLNFLLKINLYDENDEIKINLSHIRKMKNKEKNK